MTVSYPERKNTLSSQRCSMEIEVKQQLAWINSKLETASGSERRALKKAREELSWLIRVVEDIERSTLDYMKSDEG